MVITAYNLFPLEAERAIDQHFEVSETLASPDGLTECQLRDGVLQHLGQERSVGAVSIAHPGPGSASDNPLVTCARALGMRCYAMGLPQLFRDLALTPRCMRNDSTSGWP